MKYSALVEAIQWNLFIKDTIGTSEIVLHMEVSLIQRLSNTIMYYCGTGTSPLNTEVPFIQKVLSREFPPHTTYGHNLMNKL